MFKEFKTLRIFFEEPNREFNVREVARIIKKSPTTTSKNLKNFSKNSLLKERKERLFNLYKANLESDFYRDFKIFYNLRKIKDCGFIDAMNKFYLKPSIVLFGSAAFGIDTEDSDFDFLILSEKTKGFADLNKYEKKLKRKIQIFVVKNIKDLKNEHLINNVLNGIIIQGRVKWI